MKRYGVLGKWGGPRGTSGRKCRREDVNLSRLRGVVIGWPAARRDLIGRRPLISNHSRAWFGRCTEPSDSNAVAFLVRTIINSLL